MRWRYYEEIGYSKEKEKELRQQFGFEEVYKYWKPFEAYAVTQILKEYDNHVIDFGAGHSVYEEQCAEEVIERLVL
ncbi:hypothetical protein [Paenibacillus sp. Marseille-Q4541]|uniref:hypothetical protein n=1 Tax=Paenibacillus sp. Marseille-Q4541 TaxID=2831522 RepID=UPI001BADBFF5|nr:hypothetical protein [Paenibacillus sp. Marseille-Q4541]